MFHIKMALTAALLACATGARADDTKPAVPFDDIAFSLMASSGAELQVELGEIAEKKATRAEVKAFATQMVKDHKAMQEELQKVAKSVKITVSGKITEADQKHLDALKEYAGTDFDAQYLKHVIDTHTTCVQLLKQASKEAKHKELRDLATKYIPVVEAHVEQAKKLTK